MDKIYSQFYKTVKKLQEYIDLTDITDIKNKKLTFNYVEWLEIKTNIIINEDTFTIPSNVIPNKINKFAIKHLSNTEESYIAKFYNKTEISSNEYEYTRDNSVLLNDKDVEGIVKVLFLKRPYVVWVNFGFNIDNEFGGKHPAIILKRTEDSLFVIPLSSGNIPNEKLDKPYCNEIPYIQGLKAMPRWFNAYRIASISIQRIDYNSPIGRIQGKFWENIESSLDCIGIKDIMYK